MPYPEEMIAPMRKELTKLGVQELRDAKTVDTLLKNQKETVLIIVNSMCGCAARTARPAFQEALKNKKIPKTIATVFAGQDLEATSQLREKYLKAFPPSSPAFALFKNNKPVTVIGREEIMGYEPEIIEKKLKKAFDEFC